MNNDVQNEQILDLNTFNQRFLQAYGSEAHDTFIEKNEPIAENNIDTEPEKASLKEEELDQQKGKRPVISILSSVIFYGVLIGAVLLAFVSTGKSKGPRDIFGFSYFTVLSGSMQKEIPKGSFVLTKKTDAKALQIGDNITFMKNPSTTITHKIIGIYEDYDGSDQRKFQTQGVNNALPDTDMVDASNIVGKVVLFIPVLGALLFSLSENLIFALIFLGLLLFFSFALQIFFKVRKEERLSK